MKKIKFALLAAGLAASAQALAEGGGVYFGGSLGKAESKTDACFLDTAGSVTCDRKGEGAWAAFAGLMVNKYFGVEGGYHNLGKIVEVADPATGNRAWVRSYIGELVAVGAFPIQNFALYAKGGGYYAKSTQTGSFSFIAPDTKSTNTQWTYGVGASWDVFRHAGLRVEWQRFNNVGGEEIGFRSDVDLMSLGAYIKF